METFIHNQNRLKCNSDFSTIGSRIKYYRLLNDFTQEDLAIKSGLDRCTINRYENDLVDHSLDIINKISKSLKINPHIIYDDYLKFLSSDYNNKIKLLRINLRLTQKDLATLLKVNRKTIYSWEKQVSYPTRYNYMKIVEIDPYNNIQINFEDV